MLLRLVKTEENPVLLICFNVFLHGKKMRGEVSVEKGKSIGKILDRKSWLGWLYSASASHFHSNNYPN